MPLDAQLVPTLRTVFLAYGAFWIAALVILYFAVGVLMARAERGKKH